MSNIVGPLPFNIVDGQIADAAPVMGNLNFIRSQVNTNAAGGTASSAGSYKNSDNPGSVTSGVPLVIGATGVPQRFFDLLSEWSAGTFTAAAAGLYLYQVKIVTISPSATFSAEPYINFVLGGGMIGATPIGSAHVATFPVNDFCTWGTFGIFRCPAAGGTITANLAASFSPGSLLLTNYQISFIKVG